VTSQARARAASAWRAIAFVPTRRLALGVALLAPLWLLSRLPGGGWIAFGATVLLALAALIDVAMLPAARDLRRFGYRCFGLNRRSLRAWISSSSGGT